MSGPATEEFPAWVRWLERNHLRVVLGILAAFVVVLGLAIASVAHADDLIVSWTNPTHNTTGTAIPASGPGSLTGTRLEWGSCSGTAFGTKAGEVTAPAGATSATIAGVAPAATYCVRAFSRNTYGAESASSNVASKVVPVPVPNPPVLAVPVIAGMTTTPVYSVTKAGALSAFVGFADVGTPCTGPVLFTYRSKSFREVPRTAVKLWGATSLRLAAPCSAG